MARQDPTDGFAADLDAAAGAGLGLDTFTYLTAEQFGPGQLAEFLQMDLDMRAFVMRVLGGLAGPADYAWFDRRDDALGCRSLDARPTTAAHRRSGPELIPARAPSSPPRWSLSAVAGSRCGRLSAVVGSARWSAIAVGGAAVPPGRSRPTSSSDSGAPCPGAATRDVRRRDEHRRAPRAVPGPARRWSSHAPAVAAAGSAPRRGSVERSIGAAQHRSHDHCDGERQREVGEHPDDDRCECSDHAEPPGGDRWADPTAHRVRWRGSHPRRDRAGSGERSAPQRPGRQLWRSDGGSQGSRSVD